ncbi:replication/maintenance protein RepL [Tenacibaculum finnmarkense genomovar finnmarkense]|uniref:replication/maintenance protein RepL n=1 Tax=Tenacibaculum finnmarkense TaxID=2781243 RepID=UPI001E623704|nr:replication/maintenance protein RepL [Tenacibaculum finnmarkense]MCD8450433.1 replication/maintenance protein RepL [Tenacibaculum dicentrarchi]MCG8203586.1 replication/maintenance protein RepL [Tenacibaculum finnmarkense genomovar finnmarkense]MCG8245109.1 replication/maintenance protein RepL [Tenacibaculum finnmarkense genomovar finnmarkense]MCG8849699.1 hypothetical protein [Tenacibaculum finnmarkense]MCM8863564.1 replication/maintenance protein RepL [Tenacibaculum finnmarkense genomovar 
MAITHVEKIISPDGTITVREVHDDSKIISNKKDKLKGGEFVFIFQKTVLDIVSSGLLGKNEYRILLYLMAKTEFEKEINITQYRIAKELGMQENAVGLVLRKLDSFNILIRDNKLKRLRLNYEIGYKGSPKNYKKIQYNDNPVLEIPPKQTKITDKNQQIH